MPRDKAYLVTVRTGIKSSHHEEFIERELIELTESAGGAIVGSSRAYVESPSASYFIRSGKLDELREGVIKLGATLLIFSVDLTPAQARNIEDVCGVRAVDRTGLILDIFSRRATSSDGKLQVELAQLQYLLPRLVGRGVIMSRLGGGIGTRGPGEQKLEVDRRKIRHRIQHIKKQLEKLRKHRALLRSGRLQKQFKQIAIVGYTNAGKSTLLNALTGADAYVQNKLFATLDPKTRVYKDKGGESILFTDTVGFIRELPHSLVKAFHATLEETINADAILIVLDVSDKNLQEHRIVVDDVLKQLGAAEKIKILALNKSDLLDDSELKRIKEIMPDGVLISAREKYGIKELTFSILEYFGSSFNIYRNS